MTLKFFSPSTGSHFKVHRANVEIKNEEKHLAGFMMYILPECSMAETKYYCSYFI